ncbi:MAG: ATP-binding protein [Anaeromyxobacter sp.]
MDFAILEAMPDALVIADEAGTILYVNESGEALFGYPRERLLGRPVEVLLPARFRAMHQVHRSGYQGAPRRRPMGLGLELSGLRQDGSEFPAEISLAPLRVDGRPCTVAAVRDVTERRKVEAQARLTRRAQEEVRERDEFLSIASHELRTPITALQLQLQLLLRGAQRAAPALPGQLEHKVDLLGRQTRRIAELVNELLDVSRMRLGHLELRREPVDLAEVARESAQHAEGELRRAGSELRLGLMPVPGLFDRIRLGQVITNLLVNAAKFGEGKPITLEVAADGDHALVVVRDLGIGIAEEHQARVFERFERAVPVDHFGGFGLGLYIARQIVERHGGSLGVDSQPGAGSVFTARLPRTPPAIAAADTDAQPDSPHVH